MTSVEKMKELYAQAQESKAIDNLGYFYERWQDEKEYEDWKDYDEQIRKSFKMFTITQTMKRPFGFKFTIDKDEFRMTVKKVGNKYLDIGVQQLGPPKPAPQRRKGKNGIKTTGKNLLQFAKTVKVGDFCKMLILDGHSTEVILNEVKRYYPKAKTSKACVNWYKSKLGKEGKKF